MDEIKINDLIEALSLTADQLQGIWETGVFSYDDEDEYEFGGITYNRENYVEQIIQFAQETLAKVAENEVIT